MIPSIGSFCKYYFSSPFTALNGAYKVVSAMSLSEALNELQIDFVKYLYKPANLDGSTYTTDVLNWTNDNILELVSPGTTTTTIYVPSSIIASLPDPTVSKYSSVYLSVPLGYFPTGDSSAYSYVASQVSDIAASVTGVPGTAAFFANPDNDIYYTNSEYEALDKARQAKIVTLQPLQTQLTAANATITALKAQIAALESIITNQSS